MTAGLDRIDRRILYELMRDSTLPVAQLADRVGLSQTPCWKRVQKLEAAGVITGRVALVAPEKIGLGLTVFVEIEAAEHTAEWREAFSAAVEDCPEILEAHRLAGGADYLLKVVVPDMHAYDAFYLALTQRLSCRKVSTKLSVERMRLTTVLPIDISSA